MKTIVIMTIVMLSAFLGYGQNNNFGSKNYDQNPEGATIPASKMKRAHKAYIPYYNQNLDDLCRKNLNIRNTGIAFTALGAGLLATGGILTLEANKHSVKNGEDGYHPEKARFQSGATACFTIGTLSILAGIPLAAIGASKVKRYCRTERAYLLLHSGENGTGLAMNF